MSSEDLRRAAMVALSSLRHPVTGRDLVASGHVQKLRTEGNTVRFDFHLQPNDPSDLVKQARSAVGSVRGVEAVKVDVQLPQMAGSAQPARGQPARGRRLQPGSVPAPTPKPNILPGVSHVVAVSSGKGGVGKSMVATNLAVALARGSGPAFFGRRGRRVGLLDADIYGPNVPLMFGAHARPRVTGSKGTEMIEPLEAHGVRFMSLGLLLERDQPAIMRGPLISGVLKQFLEQVRWGSLDVMVVDRPPGTGDAQLSLVQTVEVRGVVMVTTPQAVATGDVRRGVKMFERVNTRVLGIVENMAGLCCPHCGEVTEVFGSGGGKALATEMDLPFLGSVPLDPEVRDAGDRGTPTIVSSPDSAAGRALTVVASSLWKELAR